MGMPTILLASDLATDLAKQNGEASPLADRAIKALDSFTVRDLAIQMLADLIRHERRNLARQVEQAHTPKVDSAVTYARRARLTDDVTAHMDEVSRALAAGEISLDAALTEQTHAVRQLQEPIDGLVWDNPNVAPLIVRVAATVRDVTEFEDVYLRPGYSYSTDDVARRYKITQAQNRVQQRAEHNAGARDARQANGFPRISLGMDADLAIVLSQYRERVRLDLTQELLSTKFSTGAGRDVTWGAATIGDHAARIAAQTAHAAGTLEDVERHKSALLMLQESGVATLDDLVNFA